MLTFALVLKSFTFDPWVVIYDSVLRVAGAEPDDVLVQENSSGQYSMETLLLAIITGTVTALIVGFAAGFICGRKCQKDDDDNIPYPDTEYEYFEQRQNANV